MRFLSLIRINENSGLVPSEKLMGDMGQLIDELTRAGKMVATAGLRPTREAKRIRMRQGKLTTLDGPFIETKEVIGGYAMLEADSMEEALELTRRFMRLHEPVWEFECEVRQLEGSCTE